MSTIPEELLEQFERGNVLLLIGEGINQGILPSSQELARELAARCDYPPEELLSLARVASYYELTRDRHGLILFLRERLSTSTISPTHQLLTRLGVRVMVTTCVDQLLAGALREAQVAYTQVVGNSEIAYSDEQRLLLVHLWGVLDQPDSLIITEDDQRRFLDGRANLSDVLRGELAQRTWLFIGFEASEEWFRSFYDQVTRTLDRHHRRAYILGSDLGPFARAWWQKRNAELLDLSSEPFLRHLIQELAARRRPSPAAPLPLEDEASPLPLPERPYKFLDYYEAKDAAIFYGRQQETQHLCALIHAHRLVLLYGASGVGKTSLLLAGAVPRLERATPPYKTIYIRALENPTVVIRRTLRRQLPDANLPNEGSLVDFLSAVTTELGQSLVIILDQFEEFFIRLSPQFRAAFISELGAVYDATDVPVKVVFSLREDWLASMDEIEARIPDLFRTRMRVSRLTRTQARQAITAPVERLGISYDPALLERLLADLLGSNQEVMPPQLQLICSALYDRRQEDEQVIRVATYERLGGVQGVLRSYLKEELSRLNPAEQTLARAILEELVTSEKTKAVKSSTELALALEVKLRILVPLLEWLVRGRLLRALKQETGHRAYELTHEYLIYDISLTADTQARKQAEELLQQEVENWQRFGTVLAADKLALINDVRDALRLNDDAQALLLHSALQVGQDIEYWLNRIPDPTRRVELLTQATQNKLTIVRQRAAETLGTQDLPQSVAPLLTLALHDPNMDVRDTASQSLAQLTTQHLAIVERLKDEVERSAEADSTANSTRAAALRTLTYLPLRGLPFTLRMEVLMMRIYLRMTSLIQASLATPQGRAIAMTTALLVLLVALTYAFSANAYYVDIRLSRVPEGEDVIVIRRGYPLLKFPGLSQVLVDTGIKKSQIASDHWTAIRSEQLWRLSSKTVEQGFHKWGQDVAETLKLEHRARMHWYLGQQEKALQVILETELHLTSVQLLEQVVKVDPQLVEDNPQLAEQVLQTVLPLLEGEDWQTRNSAVSMLGQMGEANPQLVTEQVIAGLLPLLEDEDHYVRDSTRSAVRQVIEANPQLAKQVLQALLPKLSDEDNHVRERAASALAQVAEGNLQLAKQVLQALLPKLSDEDNHVRDGATFGLAQVAEGNLQLAKQVLQALLPKLSDEDNHVRYSAVFVVLQVVEANPQLATEQVLAALLPLLEDEERYVRDSALSALAQVAEGNPQLTEQVTAAFLPLLEHEQSYVRYEAASALALVAKGNPQLTKQVTAALLPRLEHEQSYVRDETASTLALVAEGNPQLAEQLIVALQPLLEEEHKDIRFHDAMSALAQVAEGNPQLAEQVFQALLPLLEDNNIDVRKSATFAVGQVVEAQLTTQKIAKALLKRLEDRIANVASSAVRTLAQILLIDSEVGFFVQEELLVRLSDEDEFVRAGAAETVGLVIESRPEIANQEVVDKLLSLLTDTSGKVCDQAGFALGEVVKVKPEVTPLVANRLIPLLLARDKEEGYNIRDNTALAWAHLVTASPETASQNPQMTDAVIDLLNYGEQPVRARATTALAMIGVVTSQPDTSQIVEALLARLASTREEDGDVQNRTIKALAQIYTGQPSPPSLKLLIPPLTAPLDSQQRRLDSQALFLVALWEPSLEQEIGEELEELSNSQEPHERLIANQTLQMLKIASKAHEAAKLDGTQREEATNRLQTLCEWNDYSHRCTTANFFGEEFTWAVGEAVYWLEQQTNEEKAE